MEKHGFVLMILLLFIGGCSNQPALDNTFTKILSQEHDSDSSLTSLASEDVTWIDNLLHEITEESQSNRVMHLAQ